MKVLSCSFVLVLAVGASAPTPTAVAQNSYVAATRTPNQNQVHTLDYDLNSIGSFSLPGNQFPDFPNGIATDGTTIWVVHHVGTVYGYDMSGTPQFSWPVSSGNRQGLVYISVTEVGVASPSTIKFYNPFTGAWIRDISAAEGGGGIEGLTYDGTYLWQLGNNGLYATDVNTGAILITNPNPAAGGCAWAGTGLANSGPNELTIACESGVWFKVDKSTGATTSSGNNALGMLGLEGIPNGSIGVQYCNPATPNSTGLSGVISVAGSLLVSLNDVTVMADQLPSSQFGLFLNSLTQGFVPNPGGSQGILCLGAAIGRYNPAAGYPVQSSGTAGSISIVLDLPNTPTPTGFTSITAGQTWNFQAWYRDLNPGPTSNFTDAVAITFL